MSTRYLVEIDIRTVGSADFGAKSVERAAGAADKFRGHLDKAQAAAMGLHGKLMGVADRAAGVAMGFAKWGAVAAGGAGLAAISYGVMGINRELEKTTISLGAIFGAQGVTADLPAGLRLAEGTITKMRADAAKLPGEFRDLVNIFTTASIPALRSGADVTGFADLSAKAMAAGAVASMPLDQVGREFAMLLEGRAGAHNVFGMRLLGLAGDAAEEFNRKAAPERLAIIGRELNKYGAAIDAFGESFEGKWTTAIDGAKELVRVGTKPLFDKAKDALGDINEWLTSPAAMKSVEAIGQWIADAFVWGRQKIEEWGPSLEKFAFNAWVKLSEIWVQVQPYVEKFAAAVQRALEDPGTIDKLITLLKLYVAAKVGGEALSIGAGVAGTAGNLALAGKTMGWFGGGAAATAAGGAAAGAGGAAAATAAKGGALAVGGAWASVGAAAAGVAAFGWQLNELRKDIASGIEWDERTQDYKFSGVSEERQSMARNWAMPDWAGGGVWANEADRSAISEWAQRETEELYKTTEGMQVMRERLMDLESAAASTKNPLAQLRVEYYDHAFQVAQAKRALEGLSESADDVAASLGSFNGTVGYLLQEAGDGIRAVHAQYIGDAATRDRAAATSRHKGGGGGTSIQKVEIVVTSNQDPSRVARATIDELGKLARFRRESRYVTNYSQAPR